MSAVYAQGLPQQQPHHEGASGIRGHSRADAVKHWSPVISPSGMVFYTGDVFPT